MLPRRVIIEHGLDVMECLLLRNPGQDVIQAVSTVHDLGPQLAGLVQRRDELRAERNTISGKFRQSTSFERESLRELSRKVAEEINNLERTVADLQATIERCEAQIPNIPAPDVPLPSRYTEEEAAWKRLLLRRVHRLIAEENT